MQYNISSKKFCFIGSGNMAFAIMRGLIDSKTTDCQNISVYDIDEARLAFVKEQLSINIINDYSQMTDKDIIVIAVKPYIVASVLEKLSATKLSANAIVVSMAASVPTSFYSDYIKNNAFVRIMPNTPIEVLEGFTSIIQTESSDKNAIKLVDKIFGKLGSTAIINESEVDAYTAIAGCAPAYVYALIESACDACVLLGIPKKSAIELVSQVFLGSAKMALTSGIHPSVLKDNVCTPKGITIEGLRTMHEKGIPSGMIETIVAAYNKSKSSTK